MLDIEGRVVVHHLWYVSTVMVDHYLIRDTTTFVSL